MGVIALYCRGGEYRRPDFIVTVGQFVAGHEYCLIVSDKNVAFCFPVVKLPDSGGCHRYPGHVLTSGGRVLHHERIVEGRASDR